MRSVPPRLAAILPLLLPPLVALAQQTTGDLEGRALDAKGEPIPFVNVIVTGPALQGVRGVQTTAHGTFTILVLPVGTYTVSLSSPAYKKAVLEAIPVRLGQRTSLGDVRLEERVYEMEAVEVKARPPLIDPRSTVVGGTLAADDYEDLPIERDYRSVVSLLPEANQSFFGDPVNFAGSTGIENRYFIDGIDVTEPTLGNGGASLPYNFVQEIQVRTGGYEAEFRSALGGTVNAITYSGGNNVTGQAFGFYTNNWFSAAPRDIPGQPPNGDFALYDVGVGLGGPVSKDRLWYYVAYNPSFTREDVEIPSHGTYVDRTTAHRFAGKLTWRAAPRHTVALTTIGDPTNRDGADPYSQLGPGITAGDPDPFLNEIRTGTKSLALEGRHTPSDHFLVKSFISRSIVDDVNLPATDRGREPLFIDGPTNTWSGGTGDYWENQSIVTLAGLAGTWLSGNHELKAGLEYKNTHYDFPETQEVGVRRTDSLYIYQARTLDGRLSTRITSVFVQDSWKFGERLRLNAGLRWDGVYIVSPDGGVAQSMPNEWQPRVGFTYRLGGATAQKIFGSAGRFYQELATYPLIFYYSGKIQTVVIRYDHDFRIDPSGGDTLLAIPSSFVQPEIDGMEGQHFDEFTLGYERSVAEHARLGLRGIYRTLRQAFEDGFDPVTGDLELNNPGEGHLSAFPRVQRHYGALEATYQGKLDDRLSVLASYVLSRNYGNYPGLMNTDVLAQGLVPNITVQFDHVETMTNAEGLLPNDRTHTVKLSGRYELGPELTIGAVGVWESGTPLNELGGSDFFPSPAFLRQRGTAGRTPAIWDLSLRLGYSPLMRAGNRWRPKVTVDFLHVASQREVVNYDQVHYYSVDSAGNQTDPNPNYGQATAYQPPMAVRVGAEVRF